MALNLSTLTNASTSGTVLTEALTTADFLDSVPILSNLANRGNKGGDAKQTVGSNQPKALPLVNGSGYVYLPNVTGNAPAVDFPNVPSSTNYVLTIVADIQNPSNFHFVTGVNSAHRFAIFTNQFYAPNRGGVTLNSAITTGLSTFVIEGTGSAITLKQNGVTKATVTGSTNGFDVTHISFNGQYGGTSIQSISGLVKSVVLTVGGTESVNIDFAATNIRHGDTKFKCATGQVVTINQSGNDPGTIIKKPVLRFANKSDASTNIALAGLLNQTVTGGYMFAAFSVLGDGGEAQSRIFSMNSTGAFEYEAGGFDLRRNSVDGSNLEFRYNGASAATLHQDVMDDSLGDILFEHQFQNGAQVSKLNNANEANGTTSVSGVLSSEEFRIAELSGSNTTGAFDLEYLALFPATITDAQADSVRNYINNRNNVFSLIDSQGYYFYDAQKAPVGAITTGSASWNGRIIGSDFGDSDRYATQGTTNEEPVGDGYVVTFADNADHLDIPQVTQAGWQVVGTSIGTFAYRVDNDAVTELNLLGNFGSQRQSGDLYGIILLPESATGADIESARRLLIDRGAADATTLSDMSDAWQYRSDLTEFKNIDFSSVTNFGSSWFNCASLTTFSVASLPSATAVNSAWRNCGSLTSFNTDLAEATNVSDAWLSCSSLSNFGPVDISKGTNFSNAWKSCSSLTSFASGAKLGTSAQNVNFTSAWRDSGLTSFSTPLPTATNLNTTWYTCTALASFSSQLSAATRVDAAWYGCVSLSSFTTTEIPNCSNFSSAWHNCSSLTSFASGAKLGTAANNVNFTSAWQDSGLTSFPADIDLSQGTDFFNTWRGTDLTSFETPITSAKRFPQAWQSCGSLTNFSSAVFQNWNPSSLLTGVFHRTWKFCTALTAQSVENILTSIDASGKYATSDGDPYQNTVNTQLADAGIDIDYDGTTLSAATDSAITSLRVKGWVIFINGVERIP
jgi:hypothetical protein